MLSILGFLQGAMRRKPRPSLAGIRTLLAAALVALHAFPSSVRAADIPMTLEGGISATRFDRAGTRGASAPRLRQLEG